MSEKRICPLRNDECLGRTCALAQRINSSNVSAYDVLWTCGLVTTYDSYNHGANMVVARESRKW